MLRIKNYVKADSLEEAYSLNQENGNRIIGGMMWMRQGNGEIENAIDLSGLDLDQIEETEEEFKIGCMVTLGQLMNNESFLKFTDNAVADAFMPIVGVQFRNMATIGGSVFAKMGFSDVLTLFSVFDTSVVLHKAGEISLQDFLDMKKDGDIITHVIIRKTPGRCCYQAVRGAKTDLPILNCAARFTESGEYRLAFGGRPGRAVLVTERDDSPLRISKLDAESADHIVELAAERIKTGKNMRGSAKYRAHLVKVLAKRSTMILGGGHSDH